MTCMAIGLKHSASHVREIDSAEKDGAAEHARSRVVEAPQVPAKYMLI